MKKQYQEYLDNEEMKRKKKVEAAVNYQQGLDQQLSAVRTRSLHALKGKTIVYCTSLT